MKTSCPIAPPSFLTIRKLLPLAALVRLIGRVLPVLAGIAMVVQLSVISTADAAAPDGQYRFISASGKLRIDGQTFNLSEDALGSFGALKNRRATVRNNHLQLYRKQAAALLDEMFSSYPVTVKVSGPSSIRLKKKGAGYVGTSRPLVLNISGKVEGRKFSGRMQWTYKVVVRGRKLIVTAPISGSIAGSKVSGTISITCRK